MSRKPTVRSRSTSAQFGRALRRYFVTGLATLFPVAVTLWLVVVIFRTADRFLGRWLGIQIPGLGLIVTILLIMGVGVFSVHFFGRAVFLMLEAWLSRLPLVKKIYPPVKQLAQFLFNEESRRAALQRVVLVQYPRPGTYSLAFVTNETVTTATGASRRLLTLVIPNPPSPFTGPIIFVPAEEVIPLEMSVEEAVKLIVSGGIVASELRAAAVPSPR